MDRPISLILLVVGIILMIYSINASHAVGSDVSRSTSADKILWLLFEGVVLSLVGLVGALRSGRSRLE